MRLHIIRSQAKGILGGIKFELLAKCELTPEEWELVKKYKVEEEPLLIKTDSIFGYEYQVNITIRSLIHGETFKCKNIGEILEMENNVKEACKIFKIYLEVMKAFGGEEIIEYTIDEKGNVITKTISA